MSDELPVEDDGAVDTPNPVNYEQRWKDTHANWNQLNEQMTRFKQDPNAIIEFIQETHPDLLAEDDEEPEPEEDFEPDYEDAPLTRAEFREWQKQQEQRLGKLEPWQQAVENERGERRFNDDLKAELGDREVNGKVRDWIKDRTAALGNNPKALKQAVEEWAEIAGELTAKPKPKPRAPHVPRAGEAVTGGKAWADMTPQEALEAQMELARSLDTQI